MNKTEENSRSYIKATLSDDEVLVFHALKETQLCRYNEPDLGLFIAESPYVIERALEAGYEPVSFLAEEEQLNEKARKLLDFSQAPVYVCSHEELKNLVGYRMTRGLLCALKRKPNPDIRSILEDKQRIVVLENIVNPTNLGAIIRSAAALGIEAAVLTKGCSDPLQRRASRVSMGNVFALPWCYMDTHIVNIDLLKELGFITVSMALTETARKLDEISFTLEKYAIILGTEGDGLCDQTIENSDLIVKIPMSNNVDSLNVAAASAVVFWHLRDG